jgi:ubiquinone biosynthesis protein
MLSLKPEHVRRYRDIIHLLARHGRPDLIRHAGLNGHAPEAGDITPAKAESLADDLEKMGPTFVKLGQLLSTRPDLLPQPYLDALERLQDKVEPFPYEEAERIFESELNVKISRAFASFEARPIAAASLGQVHRARMRDGREVAVKIQRPGIRQRIADDFEALGRVADLLDRHTDFGRKYGFARMLEEVRKSLIMELDYRREASNLTTLRRNLREFDLIVVPRPVDDYTTGVVLTMDYVEGTRVTALGPAARVDLRGRELARQLVDAYLKQLLIDGFMHADPHPGNVFLTPEGKLALLDLGMVARIPPGMQHQLLRMILALSEARGEDAAEAATDLGQQQQDFDRGAFERLVCDIVAQHHGTRVGELQVGRIVLNVGRAAAESGIRVPVELTMVGQTLLKLDEVGRILDPGLDPNVEVRRNAIRITRQRLIKGTTQGSLLDAVLETKDFLAKLPARANRILEAVSRNEIKVRVDAIDEAQLMEGVQKIANRISLSLVLASLIVGAALIMRVETRFRIFGYPGLAILFFLGAAGGGLVLAWQALFRDIRRGRKRHQMR